jgi:DNA-binding XRE family transcriptional regulator
MGIPELLRRELITARRELGWTQAELGKRVGLPQEHISVIETGKVAPRFDTLLEIVRVLGRDLMLVPRPLVPAVRALVSGEAGDERPMYGLDPEDESDEA